MTVHRITSRVEGDKVLILEREFDAPRNLVFEMFTDCEHLTNWWGPRGWTLSVCKLDFRPGGKWDYCMKCIDESQTEVFGMESCGRMVYHDIAEPERISYTDYFTDNEGTINNDLPAAASEVEFIDLGTRTKLLSRTEYATAEALKSVMDMGMLDGIGETWDRLEERLAAQG